MEEKQEVEASEGRRDSKGGESSGNSDQEENLGTFQPFILTNRSLT